MKTKEDTREDIMKRINEMISTIPTRNLKDIEKIAISVLNKQKQTT